MNAATCVACGDRILLDACPSCSADAAGHEHALARLPEETRRGRPARTGARSSINRIAASVLRLDGGTGRPRSGRDRDRAAAQRDRNAEARDSVARTHDQEPQGGGDWADVLARAARDRERAALDRAQAADDRAQAAADRELAAAERAEAVQIRAESASLLERAATDALTGVRSRGFGLDEGAREVERAHRTGGQLMLAFVDVDGLKTLNDTRGHQAGDALLQLVGRSLRANLRPYDVIMRYGGDEFVCVMPDLSAPEARARFKRIAHTLAAVNAHHSISFGLAQAATAESLGEIIARADADLLGARAISKRAS